MKRYKIVLHDGREEFVVADNYLLVEDEYQFFANGLLLSDVFFKESAVVGIKVHEENYDLHEVAKFFRKRQLPPSDYETWDPL